MAYQDYLKAEKFGAEGVVIEAKWHTSNHNMPIFIIQDKKSKITFQHYRITLTPQQIKVGDKFKKMPGSKICAINGIDVVCVD